MKKFIIAVVLLVGILAAHALINNVVYLQLVDFAWLFIYCIGLSEFNVKTEILDKRNNVKLGKIIWNVIFIRVLPLLSYSMCLVTVLWHIDFLFSMLMFLIVAISFFFALMKDTIRAL